MTTSRKTQGEVDSLEVKPQRQLDNTRITAQHLAWVEKIGCQRCDLV